MNKKSYKWIFIFAGLLLIGGGSGYWYFFIKNKQQPQYQTSKVERGTIVSSVSASGQIISSNAINVTSQTSGIVKKIFVKDGDAVTTGQKIMELILDQTSKQKADAAWNSYLSAKNALATAKQSKISLLQSLENDKSNLLTAQKNAEGTDNYDPTDPAKKKLDAARRAAELALELDREKLKNVDTQIAKAQSDLDNAWYSYQLLSPIIISPADGIISSFSVVEGMSVDASKVAVIYQQANPLAIFNLSEIDVSKIKIGQKATITLDSLSEKSFTGKVVSIDRTGAVSSGVTNYPVIIQFDTLVPEVLANMATNANIIIDAKDNVLLVPSSAIQNQGGQTIVRVLKNGKVEQVTVETGLASDTQTEIVSGLSEGDEAITSIISNATSGSSGGSVFGGFGGREVMQVERK